MQLTLVIKLAPISLGLDSFFSYILLYSRAKRKDLIQVKPTFPF